jgi:uncharacterized pyridoxamine 5'-phosphate oxidase family protein
MIENPKVSIAAIKPNRDWIRITGDAVHDESEEAKNYLFAQNPRIKDIYKDNPSEVAMFYLTNIVCVINEAGKEPAQAEL